MAPCRSHSRQVNPQAPTQWLVKPYWRTASWRAFPLVLPLPTSRPPWLLYPFLWLLRILQRIRPCGCISLLGILRSQDEPARRSTAIRQCLLIQDFPLYTHKLERINDAGLERWTARCWPNPVLATLLQMLSWLVSIRSDMMICNGGMMKMCRVNYL